MTFQDAPLLLTLKQVSTVFGFPYSSLRKWIINQDSNIPSVKIGGKHYINKNDFLAWCSVDRPEVTG